MIQKRIEKLKTFLLTFDQDPCIIVLVCHSEVIWWLTSKIVEGERQGKWTRNGEMLDITHDILHESSLSVERDHEGIYCRYDPIDPLLV
jgi:hypothetical protein